MAPEVERAANNVKQTSMVTDPTFLTTQQLLREYTSLKELVFTRLDAMDKAMELFNANITRVPTDTDKQISHLKELHDEKFEGVEKQFKERDVRTEQSAIATKIAVDAALQAQKEAASAQNDSNAAAIAKSEAATTKQIDGIVALIASNNKGLDEKIADIKGRLDRGEGKTSISDPATNGGLARLKEAVESLMVTRGGNIGHSQGAAQMVGYVVGAFGTGAAIMTILFYIISTLKLGH